VSPLARVLLDELGDDDLAELARRLQPFLPGLAAAPDEDRWMDARAAAEYLGMSVTALHKLTAKRAIPFHQDVAGGKCWFLRSELDQWRHRGG